CGKSPTGGGRFAAAKGEASAPATNNARMRTIGSIRRAAIKGTSAGQRHETLTRAAQARRRGGCSSPPKNHGSAHRLDHMIESPGPRGAIPCTRDALGYPSIRARDRLDGAFAHGWFIATDRLVQVHLALAAARGRLLELAGDTPLFRLLDRSTRA